MICFFLDKYQKNIFGKFEIGLELIIINGLLVFLGLFMVSDSKGGPVAMDAERTEGPAFSGGKI